MSGDPKFEGSAAPAAIGRTDSSDPPLTELREQQLVEAHRLGDRSASSTLLRAYQRRIYGICYRMLQDHEEAGDLTQDSLIKMLEGLDRFDGRSKLSTWVFRVAMNCCLSYLRKKRLRRHGSLDDHPDDDDQRSIPSGELSAAERVELTELQASLVRALASLDPQMRAVLVLRDLQGLDYQQIGLVLEVPVGTVKSRIFRARAALRAAAEVAGSSPHQLDQES